MGGVDAAVEQIISAAKVGGVVVALHALAQIGIKCDGVNVILQMIKTARHCGGESIGCIIAGIGAEAVGFPVEDEKPFTTYATNITQDKETGIGVWTDAEIILAIREGIRPNGGRIIGPTMPIGLYRELSDRDVCAIVAYLRQVKPVNNEMEKSTYQIPLPPAYGPPVTNVPDIPQTDKIAYGAYLAGPAGHCIECHTPFVKGRPDFANQLGAGGFPFHGPWGVSVSANITPHADGIADYGDAELAKVIRSGIRPDGSRLMPPMGVYYYANISDGDMAAIVAYLRALEAKPNPQ